MIINFVAGRFNWTIFDPACKTMLTFLKIHAMIFLLEFVMVVNFLIIWKYVSELVNFKFTFTLNIIWLSPWNLRNNKVRLDSVGSFTRKMIGWTVLKFLLGTVDYISRRIYWRRKFVRGFYQMSSQSAKPFSHNSFSW